jgi:hypothetical protein
MKQVHVLALAVLGLSSLASFDASAVACAAGVYRAGCVGPNGAVAVHRPPVYHPAPVTCARGVYHAGCVGPHGAAVVRRY